MEKGGDQDLGRVLGYNNSIRREGIKCRNFGSNNLGKNGRFLEN